MAARKKAAKKSAKKKAAVSAAKKPATKADTLNFIANETELSKKDVAAVFDALSKYIRRQLNKRTGPGFYTVPGLMKIKVVRKPATKERKGINPFTGEETIFKAKPARNVVKITPLKGLKEMV